MKLIVGLGNNGTNYERTRHNAGFMVIDRFAEANQLGDFKHEDRFRAEIVELRPPRERILLVKPTTKMNLSGQAVSAILNFYNIEPADMLVIHDDIDLPFGKLRVRLESGSAGHNGVTSIMDHLGHNSFWRFRIGVANNSLKNPIASDAFVLQPFNQEEEQWLAAMIEKVVEQLQTFVDGQALEERTINLL
jgi:PTH1 family peptidyl-tRNA hydrolase